MGYSFPNVLMSFKMVAKMAAILDISKIRFSQKKTRECDLMRQNL